jgi:formylglycine-generating enzyme required for sulfatase activity
MKTFSYLLVLASACTLVACSEDVHEKTRIDVPYIDPGVNFDAWAVVPAGVFYRGSHLHVTPVDYDYEIMVTHVTNQQYANYLNEALAAGSIKIENETIMGYHPGDKFDNYRHEFEIEAGDKIHVKLNEPGLRIKYHDKRFSVQAGFQNHPVVMVSWYGAKAYCDFYGWRLPSETEWEKAARGTDKRAYPWGDRIARNQANFYSSRDPFEKIFGKQGGSTPVGFYNGRNHNGYQTLDSQSPYGLYDMAGNVWQWTADDYPYMHYRWMRGGSNGNYEYDICVWSRNSAGPEYYGVNTGFRCARNLSEKVVSAR